MARGCSPSTTTAANVTSPWTPSGAPPERRVRYARMEPAGSLVIVNPNASQVRDAATRAAVVAEVERAVARRDGVAPHVVVTGTEADTRPAVEAALARGVRAVIGVGGDGTLRDIAELLLGSERAAGHRGGRDRQPAGGRAGPAAHARLGSRRPGGGADADPRPRRGHAPTRGCAGVAGCLHHRLRRRLRRAPHGHHPARLEAAHRQGRLLRAGAQAGRDHRRGALSPHGGRRLLRDGGVRRAGRQHGPARARHAGPASAAATG